MKTYIGNIAKDAVTILKKHEVSGKLHGREWRMLTDDPSITGKYIFLKEGKLLLSINGLSTYSTWEMATESTIIMDEGVATFLYKVIHIDDHLVVLNLDGTNNFCFLINNVSQSLAKASVEDIQWYLYRNCGIDILNSAQKRELEDQRIMKIAEKKEELEKRRIEQEKEDAILNKALIVTGVIAVILIIIGILSN